MNEFVKCVVNLNELGRKEEEKVRQAPHLLIEMCDVSSRLTRVC